MPADFVVRESLGIKFDGQGEHAYLHVRKCGLNTSDVLEQLQSAYQLKSVDVGVSGLKDKQAITDQWFSVRTNLSLDEINLPKIDIDTQEIALGDFAVLDYQRHSKKLRRGAHQANRFVITLKDVVPTDQTISTEHVRSQLDERLDRLKRNGFANYFGPQRFGLGGQNLIKAERYFANPRKKISRTQRGLLISSARSHLFNKVCQARVRQGTWNTPLSGEPMQLHGTHSFFINDVDTEDVLQRCKRLDIHPSGPMWGVGETLSTCDCREFEESVLDCDVPFKTGLTKAGLKQQRRALRACISDLRWSWHGSDTLVIEFELLKGVYATSFLSEFMIYS